MKSEPTLDAKDILTLRALSVAVRTDSPDQRVLVSAAHIIRQGGVIAYPTETFYGLGADPFNARAVERVRSIKGRPAHSPMILLVAHAGMTFELARLTGPSRLWYDGLTRWLWPGPLTLILPRKARLSCPALGGGDTVAVRVSSHPVARQLVRTTGHPIVSTSANITGDRPAAQADRLDPVLASKLDLILDSGPVTGEMPSTLLDLTGRRPEIRRRGAVSPERIEAILGFRPLVADTA